MPNIQGVPMDEQVKKLLEQNLAYSREIYILTKKVKNYIMWGRIMSIISLVVFVILPIIAGFVYMPSLLNGINGIINPAGVLDADSSSGSALQGIFNESGLKEQDLINFIENQGGPINAYKNILDLYKSQ